MEKNKIKGLLIFVYFVMVSGNGLFFSLMFSDPFRIEKKITKPNITKVPSVWRLLYTLYLIFMIRHYHQQTKDERS